MQTREVFVLWFYPQVPSCPLCQENEREDCKRDKSTISFLPRFLVALPSRIGTFGIPAGLRQCLLLNRDYKNQDWAQKWIRIIIRNNLKLNSCRSGTPKRLSFGLVCYLLPPTSRKSKLGQVHRIWIVNMEISFTKFTFFSNQSCIYKVLHTPNVLLLLPSFSGLLQF